MSRVRRGRSIDGILLLDKPLELGSNEVLQRTKRLFQARKAGHTGSLDRLASGLLPLCFGEATKLSGFLLDSDKRYQSVFRLGVTTTTGDAEGEVLETRAVPTVSDAELDAILRRFTGEIKQVPPMHSALKHKGQRLYKLAHRGLTVPREPRSITIFALQLLERGEDFLRVTVHCSKGTYIRTLGEDIGAALGCGAHVIELRRTHAGPYDIADAVDLDGLHASAELGLTALDDLLLPMESALGHWPSVSLPAHAAFYLRQGQPVLVPHAPTEGLVRVLDEGATISRCGRSFGRWAHCAKASREESRNTR